MKFSKLIWLVSLSAVVLSACTMGATPAPTQDPGAVQTQAMEIVATQLAMQQTQTAMAFSPTPQATLTPLATATVAPPTFASVGGSTTTTPVGVGTVATPGVGTPFAFNTPAAGFTAAASPVPTQAGTPCNEAIFISETVPDGTVFKPGKNFEKAWQVQNGGTCMWDEGYVLRYLGGSLDGYDIELKKSSDFVGPGEMQVFKVNLTASLVPNVYQECWRMQDDKGYYFGTYLCVKIEVKE
ncbi:MAG: hypothetical protein HZB19_13910 [Chloroflexi bacterium]|nr:hypothetical protein [Chloroflexota bacterium]